MKIYFYSFQMAYEDQVALGQTPLLKIGQTTQDSVETRILQQMGTATPQKFSLKGQFEVSFTDKQFHHFLQDRGITRPDGQGTEWFYISAEAAEELLYEFAALQSGIATPIRLPLDVRPYQEDFVRQFVSTSGDFLLFAKCRAGKSVMGLLAATEADFRSVLVVSLRTSAANSWLKDPSTFTCFHEWDAIDLHDSDAVERIQKSQKAGRRTLMVGTVQATDEKFALQAKLKRIFPEGIDALYLDECHIGGLAEMVTKLKKAVCFGRVLEISGTAFRAAYFYDREHTFTWDYTREQRAKRQGLAWAQKLPTMELILVRYDASRIREIYGDDPDRISNLWTVENGEWFDAAGVRNFFSGYFAHGSQVHKRRQLFRDSNHIIMSLPSVEACHKAVETFSSLGLPWAPLAITGDTGVDQDAILAHVTANPRTICFTRWANVVGVTVPQWDTVVHGCKTDSAEFWVQFSFRAGSTPNPSWKVVDFVPEQTISSVISMVQAVSDSEEDAEPGSSLRTFLEFADTQEFDNGFTSLDFEGVLGFISEDLEGAIDHLKRDATRLGSYGEYTDSLAKAFSGSDGVRDVQVLNVTLNGNDTQNTGNTRVQQSRAASANEKKRLLAQIKGALEFVPAVVAVHHFEGVDISSVSQLLNSSYLRELTGVSGDGFKAAIDGGWISSRELSSLVSRTHLVLAHEQV